MRLGSFMVDTRPLRVDAFRQLWIATTVTAVAGSFSLIAVPTQLFTLAQSSAPVGVAGAISMVTLAASALWSGALADRMDRRLLLLAANIGLGVAYAGLFLVTVTGVASVPVLLTLVGLQGVSYGAALTVSAAAVPRVVPAEMLVPAISLSMLTRYTGAVIGPLLAGALIPVWGVGPLYLSDAVALTVACWAVSRLPAIRPDAAVARTAVWRQLADGARYLAGQRLLVAVLAVDLAAMVLALPVAVFPELAERTYGHGLGLLFAAYPAGVLLTGLLSGRFSRASRHGALMAGAAIIWGGCVVVLSLASQLWLALLALFAGGMVNFVLSTFRNAITQAYVDDALRGRIQGFLTVVLIGGPQLANVWHGLGAAAFGARLVVGVGGAAAVVAVAAVLRAVPAMWRYQPAPHQPESHQPESHQPVLSTPTPK